MSGGFDEVSNGLIAPNSPWYTITGYPQYDQTKARELVAKVKETNGGKFAFTVIGATDKQTQLGFQLLQEQWREVGIDATVELSDAAKVIINVVTGNYQAVSWSQFDSPTPYADGVWWDPRGAIAPPPSPSTSPATRTKRSEPRSRPVQRRRTSRSSTSRWRSCRSRLAADVPYIWLTHTRRVDDRGGPRREREQLAPAQRGRRHGRREGPGHGSRLRTPSTRSG